MPNRRNSPIREILEHIEAQETLHTDGTTDLKIETEVIPGLHIRFWRSRLRWDEGGRLNNGVTVELRLDPEQTWTKLGEL